MMKISTIAINISTRNQLKHLGRKGQTYDSIIRGLIDTTKKSVRNLPDFEFGDPGPGDSSRT
jgi:hypothetical protein